MSGNGNVAPTESQLAVILDSMVGALRRGGEAEPEHIVERWLYRWRVTRIGEFNYDQNTDDEPDTDRHYWVGAK